MNSVTGNSGCGGGVARLGFAVDECERLFQTVWIQKQLQDDPKARLGIHSIAAGHVVVEQQDKISAPLLHQQGGSCRLPCHCNASRLSLARSVAWCTKIRGQAR